MSTSFKKWLVLVAFLLFSLALLSLFYLFTTPGQTANIAFAYAVGLTMIVLPCTLPLAFVIVPMAMNKGGAKGLLMAIFFGLGLAITLSLYGLFVALIGKSIGLDKAIGGATLVSKILFMVGGLAAFFFGLSELGLVKFKMPSYKGAYPEFIQKQGDYLKAFFLGLFLGNAGVGCPNPLFYVLLGDIAVTGSALTGWWLGFIHGIGRATPLLFLAILGLLGVNAVSGIATKTAVVTKWTGISLVLLGAFIFISGSSHQWYENSYVHREWNKTVEMITGANSGVVERDSVTDTSTETGVSVAHTGTNANSTATPEKTIPSEEPKDLIPAPWSWIVLLLMSIVPLVWYWKKSKEMK